MIAEVKEGNRYMVNERIDFYLICCCQCAVAFMVPARLQEHFKQSKQAFYCPNGHRQVYTKSTEEELREKLRAATTQSQREDQLQRQVDSLNQNVSHLENKLLDTINDKNKLQRKLKRVDNGVCPYGCKRHFTNLERHIKTKHTNPIQPKK